MLIGKIIDSDLRFNTFLKEKKLTFQQWKVWLVTKQIDLQRQILVLEEYRDTLDLKESIAIRAAIRGKRRMLNFFESLQRRVSSNDTIEVIQRDMKAKALRDIDKWENGNAD